LLGRDVGGGSFLPQTIGGTTWVFAVFANKAIDQSSESRLLFAVPLTLSEPVPNSLSMNIYSFIIKEKIKTQNWIYLYREKEICVWFVFSFVVLWPTLRCVNVETTA
jgi:hypothetical protein